MSGWPFAGALIVLLVGTFVVICLLSRSTRRRQLKPSRFISIASETVSSEPLKEVVSNNPELQRLFPGRTFANARCRVRYFVETQPYKAIFSETVSWGITGEGIQLQLKFKNGRLVEWLEEGEPLRVSYRDRDETWKANVVLHAVQGRFSTDDTEDPYGPLRE